MDNVILGFGAMRLPQKDKNDYKSIDMEEFIQMVDYYMEQGFDYFDTSYVYHDEESEPALKKALIERYPRESFRIADKIPTWMLTKESDNEKFANIMLERLGIEYFDVLLIHNINKAFIKIAESCNSFEYLKKSKEEGKAKKVGFSFHDKAEVLEEVLEKYGDMMDVVQIQLNYLDWHNKTVQSKKCHEICVKYNVEIIVMEPVKGGTLVNVADNIKEQFNEFSNISIPEWALRFAGSQENVSTVLSGMSNLEQMRENCEIFKDFKKINQDEHSFLMKMAREIRKTRVVDCSYCGYCVKECEMNIPIPDYFELYNCEKLYSLMVNFANYDTFTETNAPASACTQCRNCIDICTQQLDIPELLIKVADLFEE